MENPKIPEINSSNLSLYGNQANPSNIINGLKKGVGNLGLGLIGCLGLIIIGPIKGCQSGYQSYGIPGALAGTLVGTLGGVSAGVVVLLGSTCSFLYYFLLGLIRTPEAVISSAAGKEWDKDAEEWINYDMLVESELLLSIKEEDFINIVKSKGAATSVYSKQSKQKPTNPDSINPSEEAPIIQKKDIQDRTLYDLLGVEPEATSNEIKKAYYIKAKENHPDRNPNDNEAKAKFQKIAQAYQVLGDETLRHTYDTKGHSAVEGNNTMDAGMLYMMLFGNENFEPIIGELSISTQIRLMTEETKPIEILRFRQRLRELKCAVALAHRIDAVNEGDEAIFIEKIQSEATDLMETPMGAVLINLVGSIYIDRANSYLSTISSAATATKSWFHGVFNSFRFVNYGFSTLSGAIEMRNIQLDAEKRQAQEDLKNGTTEEEKENRSKVPNINNQMYGPNPTPEKKKEIQQKTKAFGGNLIKLLWQFISNDVETTLKHVCKKLLLDQSVTKQVRNRRARLLLLLGQEYTKKHVNANYGLDDFLTRIGRQTGIFSDESTEYNPCNYPSSDSNKDEVDSDNKDADHVEEDNYSKYKYGKVLSKDDLLSIVSNMDQFNIKELKDHIILLNGNHTDCLEKEDLKKRLDTLLMSRLNEID